MATGDQFQPNINPQERTENPKDIFEFFERIFGNEIFFTEDFLALEGENKDLLYQFLKVKVATLERNPNSIKGLLSRQLIEFVRREGNENSPLLKYLFSYNKDGMRLNIVAYKIHKDKEAYRFDENECGKLYLDKFQPTKKEKGSVSKDKKQQALSEGVLEYLKNLIQKFNFEGVLYLDDLPFPARGVDTKEGVITQLVKNGFLKRGGGRDNTTKISITKEGFKYVRDKIK
jgi:hypothetical protein